MYDLYYLITAMAWVHLLEKSTVCKTMTRILTCLHFTINNSSIFSFAIHMVNFSGIVRFLIKTMKKYQIIHFQFII